MTSQRAAFFACLFSLLLLTVNCGGDPPGPARPTPSPTPTPKPTPAPFSKPLETACNDNPRVSHAYSECGDDGFWHVVQDDTHDCPPLKTFRVKDTPTQQRCKEGAGEVVPPPRPVGIAYKDFQGDASCQSAQPQERFITISECENGFWVNKKYRLYKCVDGSLRIKEPAESLQRTEVACKEPPPKP